MICKYFVKRSLVNVYMDKSAINFSVSSDNGEKMLFSFKSLVKYNVYYRELIKTHS